MTVKITFKDGEKLILNHVTHFDFPKSKSMRFNFENGLDELYFIKGIEKIEVVK